MSYLSRPRLGFFSADAMTNPSTANNENVIHLLDYDNVELLNPPVVKDATLPSMSDAAYREWMTTLLTYADPLDAQPDPQQPNWNLGMPGYWNYWGDHLTTFGAAKITSAWLDDEPVTDPARDPLCGAYVTFNARIVDLNPADTFTTQFVAAGFSVFGPDGDGRTVELVHGVPTTSVTRWLNFHRPGGAGTFQAVITHDTLAFVDTARAPNSPALRALRDGAEHGGGLLLRWCFYGMKAATPMPAMYDRFQQNEHPMNPKVGRVVGSIGVWNGDDPVSVPVGRILQRPEPPYFPADQAETARPQMRVKTHEDVERVATPGTLLHAQGDEKAWAAKVGPAAALVDGDRVTLDLNTAFPEAGTGDYPFAKHDFGTVQLELAYTAEGGPQTSVLGAVPYDTQTYEQLGGVVEVPFDPDSEAGQHIADGWLQLRLADGTVLLREIETAQVTTDDQTVYLDLDEAGRAQGSAALRVFLKGEPLPAPATVTAEVWGDVQIPGKANSVNPLVVTATEICEKRLYTFDVTVPAGGRVAVPLKADRAGCYKLRYVAPGMDHALTPPPPGSPCPPAPIWAVEDFSCYRVLPHHDYRQVPDDEVTFDFVYREVLSYYAVLYPIMSTIIPWGPDNTPHDPERVAQFASLMLQAVDESRLGTALQMPITRELSAGKRALLQRWCRLQLSGS